jgi:hypothetical protein
MQIRDRIKDFRRVKAGALRPNPRNWRTHPQAQRDAVRGVLAEIGYASALVARELDDGSLVLIDGHLRAETTPDMDVPVLVLDVTEAEAAKLLATLDPLAGLAEADPRMLADLLAEVETQNDALQAVLDQLAEQTKIQAELIEEQPTASAAIAESFQVVVECPDELSQQAVFERMTSEGFKCRVLTL